MVDRRGGATIGRPQPTGTDLAALSASIGEGRDLVADLDAVILARADQVATTGQLRQARDRLAAQVADAQRVLARRVVLGGAVAAADVDTVATDALSRADEHRTGRKESAVDVDKDLVRQQVERGALHAAREGLGALLVLPGVLVKALSQLGEVADDVADRGVDAGERVRELVGTVPPSARERRRRVARGAGLFALGAALGAVAGWVLGRKGEPVVAYEVDDVTAHLRDDDEGDALAATDAQGPSGDASR